MVCSKSAFKHWCSNGQSSNMDTLILFHAAIFACIVTPLNGWEGMGLRMCQEQCRNRRGCVAVAFDAAHLRCTLVSKHTAFRANSTLLVLKVLQTEAALKDCHQNDRLVVNKKKQLICVSTTETVPVTGYIILVPSRSRNNLYHKFRIPSENITSNHFTFKYIQAVVYLKNKNRVVLALLRKVISTSVTFRGEKHIRTIGISNMLLDEEENCLFVSGVQKLNVRVYRMTLKGQNLSVIFQVHFAHVFVMGIDTKNNWILFYVQDEILAYTYDGAITVLKVPKAMKGFGAFAFHCRTNVLYFATGSSIMKTAKSKTTMVARVKIFGYFYISDMIIFGNHLYITGLGSDHMIIRIDLTGRHQKVTTFAKRSSYKFSYAMIDVAQN